MRVGSIVLVGLLTGPVCSSEATWQAVPVDGRDIRTRDVVGVGEEIWVRPLDTENALHFDGVSWRREVTDQPGGTAWAAAAGDFWLANGGLFRSTDALRWSAVDLPATTGRPIERVAAVFGSSPDDVWVIAEEEAGQLLVHWDGEAWAADDGIRAIAGDAGVQLSHGASRGADDVWLVGADGGDHQSRLHWDGSEWTYDARDTGEYHDNRLEARGAELWLNLDDDSTVSALFRRAGDEWVETSFAEPVVHVRHFEPSSVPGEGWAVGDSDGEAVHVWHVADDRATPVGGTEALDARAHRIWTTDAGRTFVFSSDASDTIIHERVP